MLYDVFVILAGKFLTKRENKNIGVILIKLHYKYHYTCLPLLLFFGLIFISWNLCHFYLFCAPFQVFELVQFMCRPGESALGG
jgi:hypothetical protein